MVDGIQYKPVVTEGAAKQIANSLRTAIVEGHLRANERLPTELELAEKFSVSRPTIREALKRLAAQNLIRSRRGPTGGTFVKQPSQEEVQEELTSSMTVLMSMGSFFFEEINEARFELERLCARLAAERRTDDHLRIMEKEIKAQRGDISDEEFCASDMRFHHALVDASGNAVLQFMIFAVIEALQPVSNMILVRFREKKHIVTQHERIFQALLDRDSEAACGALEEQLFYMRDQYAKLQECRPPLPD